MVTNGGSKNSEVMTFKSLCRLSSNNPYGVLKSLAEATVEQWTKMFSAARPPMIEISEKNEDNLKTAIEQWKWVTRYQI